MAAGLQIINDYGTVLISDTDFVLQLKNKVTITTNTGVPRYAEVTLNNVDSPLIALKCSTHLVGITKRVRSGSSLTIGVTAATPNQSVTFDVYHFDKPVTPAAGTYGLQVFDANGACVFDSNKCSAVAVAIDPPSGLWTGTVGRSYAFAPYSSYAKYETWMEGDKGNYEYYINPAQTNGHQVDVRNSYLLEYAYDIPGAIEPYGPSSFVTGRAGGLILDVTGY